MLQGVRLSGLGTCFAGPAYRLREREMGEGARDPRWLETRRCLQANLDILLDFFELIRCAFVVHGARGHARGQATKRLLARVDKHSVRLNRHHALLVQLFKP